MQYIKQKTFALSKSFLNIQMYVEDTNVLILYT